MLKAFAIQLLTRFYNSLHAANPSLLSATSRKRYTIAPPQLFREGNKKSIFANVTEICKKMHRQVGYYHRNCGLLMALTQTLHSPNTLFSSSSPKWVRLEVSMVLVVSLSKDVSNRNRSKTSCDDTWVRFFYSSLPCPSVNRTSHPPVEYVTCKTCKSPDTLLTKENRIFFVACESCGSRRSVNAIKSGFQAQVGKRSKNKTG